MQSVTKSLISLILLILLAASGISELDAAENQFSNAGEIIEYMEDLYRGQSSHASITMTVITPHYQRELKMEAESLGSEKALIKIISPKKDRGITTLKRNEEMWNYFPKINKVIKIPPSMMMGAWMGSDFTNDDLIKESSLTEEYHLKLTETEDFYTVILTPKAKTVTVWGKIEYIVNKKLMLPVEQSYFDDKERKIRVLSFTDLKEFDGKTLPSALEMVPLNKDGYTTRITYDAIVFNPPDIVEETFSIRNLKRRF